MIRIQGKGFPDRQTRSRGDFVVTVNIDMPRHLSPQILQGRSLVSNDRNSRPVYCEYINNLVIIAYSTYNVRNEKQELEQTDEYYQELRFEKYQL